MSAVFKEIAFTCDQTTDTTHIVNVTEVAGELEKPHSIGGRLLARIKRLEAHTAQPGWDLQRGRAIPTAVWAKTREICSRVAAKAPELDPFPSPCGDGSVHVRWSTENHGELILELGAGESLDYTYVSQDGGVEVGQWGPGDDVAALVVRKLT